MLTKGYTEFQWEITNSRSGEKNLLLGGRAVYSAYDPVEKTEITARRLMESAKSEKCDHIVIIGSGLGYLPRALYEAGCKKIIIWEPFPIMQQSFPVCSGKWRDEAIIVNNYEDFRDNMLLFAKHGARPKLVIHPGYEIFCRLEHRLAVQALDDIYNSQSESRYTVSLRSLETLIRLPFLSSIKEFEGAFEGKSAVLANPGPSLKKGINALKGMDDVTVFASLQSVSYLQKNGIRVNFIVCSDPKDMSPFMAECSDDFDAFFAESSIDSGSLDWKRDKTFLFHFKCGQIHEKLWKEAQMPVIEEPTSTVSEAMLLLADYMGFKEIYCIGMDYCWEIDRYSYRTHYKYDDDKKINDMGSCFQLLTSSDHVAVTQSLYFHGARFMQYKCRELQGRGKEIYQLAGGIDFHCSGLLSLDALKKKLNSGNGKKTGNKGTNRLAFNAGQVQRLLNDIKQGRIKNGEKDSDPGRTWPFLRAIPVEEVDDICNLYLRKLQKYESL